MIYTHFIGRVGKDAKIINGKNGDFLSMDVAVSDYFKGQETTTWIRVRSNRHAKTEDKSSLTYYAATCSVFYMRRRIYY